MTRFIHTEYPLHHDGVDRAEQALLFLRQAVTGFNTTRATASLLLAAVVAALVVVANQLIEVWTDGHLMLGWVILWTVAFAAIGLLAKPLRKTVYGLRELGSAWRVKRSQAAADAHLWQIALSDARVMADISRAMAESSRKPVPSRG
jgi:hypothetical protein